MSNKVRFIFACQWTCLHPPLESVNNLKIWHIFFIILLGIYTRNSTVGKLSIKREQIHTQV